MERGDIYLVSLDPTLGHEQKGTRPVLVVSPGAFNRVTNAPIVVPITSGGGFARAAGFAVALSGSGLKTSGIVRCDQPRALDFAARRARRLEEAPPEVVDEVLLRLAPIFQ
jgi:mRNA-degrading endonuclease toxin of MazEF toxin-antitoxin module